MQWVQENIHAFGGDKDKVTIFGESAGAGSVTNHLVQPASWPFFRAAIMESGAFGYWTGKPLKMAENLYLNISDALDCDHASAECLVSKSVDELTTAAFNHTRFFAGGLLPWAPVIDGVDLVSHPFNLLDNDKAAKVPVLLGFNRDEGAMFEKTTSLQGTKEEWVFLCNGTEGQSAEQRLNSKASPG